MTGEAGIMRLRAVALICALSGILVAGGGDVAFAASISNSGFESAGVREALASQVQSPGPAEAPQGASGGSGDASAPAGELAPELSTAYSDTWRSPHHPLVTRIFAEPVNYKGQDGAWHAISDALTPSPLGGYENAANGFTLRLPESLSSSVSLSSGAGSVSFALQGASAALPAVSGDTATYREALASTDVAYESRPTGVREVATLKDANAPDALRYTLSVSEGLTPKPAAGGAIALVDGQGQVAFTIPAPVAYRPSGGPAGGRVLPSSISASGSDWTITVDTSEAWLREELAAGPVAIDPTVVSGSQACTLKEDSKTTSYCSSTELQEGYDSTHLENHALLKFNLSSLHLGYTVLNAKLGLYVTAHSTSTAKAVGVYRATKPWSTAATWETYDGTHAWSTSGGDYANPESHSDAFVNTAVGASTGWYYWYPTKLVQEWLYTARAPSYEGALQGAENEGLIVKDQSDNTTQNLLSIDSPSASSDQPYLEVAYEPFGLGEQSQYTIPSTSLTDRSTIGVNLASGNVIVSAQQLQLAGIAGFGYSDTRTWNGLDTEVQSYGHWLDSNDLQLQEYGDGSVSYEDPTGAWFEFKKQADGSFERPPGIKATMCGTSSTKAPCSTLPSGVTHRLIYDEGETRVNFSSSGASVSQEDHYEHKVSKEWTGEHTEVFTDPQGHKVEDTNGANGPTERKDLSGSRKETFTYASYPESETDLEKATDAAGATTSYEYAKNELTKITDPDGHVTKLVYDSSHRVTKIIRTIDSEHSKGPTTEFAYYNPGSAPEPCTSNQSGTVVKDPDWKSSHEHETLYCANVLGQVEKTIAYNINKEKKEEKLENAATFNLLGATTSSTAAAPGAGAEGGVTSTIYDSFGINPECTIAGTSEPLGKEPKCPSQPSSTSLVSSYHYKDTNHLFDATETENANNNKINSCYYGTAQPEKECGAASTEHPSGRLASEKDGLETQNELKFTYNHSGAKNGTIETSTDADTHTTHYEYDEKGNLKEIKPPTGIEATKITVDAVGRPHVIEDGDKHVETITYDNDNRITKIEYAGTGAARTVKLEYDGDGNLIKREDPTGTTKYSVDQLNRDTKEELPGSLSNEYSYDAASNMITFTEDGETTGYEYNGLNELAAMYEPGGECLKTKSKCTLFEYDGDRRLIKITYPSGATENYKREPATGRLETITTGGLSTGTPAVPNLTYTYKEGTNSVAHIETRTESTTGAETTYSYDHLGRLDEALTEATATENQSRYFYKLDGAGNREYEEVNLAGTSKVPPWYLVTNSANETECRQTYTSSKECSKVSSTERSHYSYDKAGEQEAITPESESGGATFGYNAASQLTKLTPSGGSELALSYAGLGQSDLVGIGSSATLQNSLLGITREVNSSGTTCFARTPTGLLIDERTPSGNYNPLYDAQGDIIALVNSSHEAARTFHYGPYGEDIKSEGTPTVPYPFGYKGGYRMPAGNAGRGSIANSLVHFGERYYDPTTGRWTQQDPVDQVASFAQGDAFVFGAGDPNDLGDPGGEKVLMNPGDKELDHRIYVPEEGECSAATLAYAPVSPRFRQNCREVAEWDAEYTEHTAPTFEAGESLGGAMRKSAYPTGP